MTRHCVLSGSFEKPLEIFVRKFRIKSKLKTKHVIVFVCFPLVTFSWKADAEQLEAWA